MNVSVIYGDGIGPDVITSAIRVVDAAGADIKWEKVKLGAAAMEEYHTPLPDETRQSIIRNRVVLKGPLTNKKMLSFPSPNQMVRTEFKLFGQVRIGKYYEGTNSKFPGTDIVCVRACLEDLYDGHELMIGPNAAVAMKPISRENATRVAKVAFDWAVKHGRKKITVGTKVNILRITDGMFIEAAHCVAKDYPAIALEEMNIDAMALHLVQKPEHFDMLLLQNVYGDIISDLVAGITGGLGISPGVNLGDEVAVFEATHGSAPKYAGKNKVNPCAMILTAALMLDHVGFNKEAETIKQSVKDIIKEGKNVTYDLNGTAGTAEMTDAIIEKILKSN